MAIKIDLNKAKEIKKDQIRIARDGLFKKYDALYIRALEANDSEEMARIVDIKNLLRDATNSPLINDAASIEELKSADPLAGL
jgi:hypothetical protein